MTVTVGIPTTGVRPVLRRCVEAAIRSAVLAGPDAEVLVVVNGRADAPGLGRVDSPMVRVAYLDQPNVSAARNLAIAQARHDVVLFADDDVLVPEPWCGQLRTALCDQGAAVVTAPVRVPVSGPVTAMINHQRNFDSQPSWPGGRGGPGTLLTANFGLRRDLVPGDVRFDEDLAVAGEDGDFNHQLWTAGLSFRLLSDAVPVQHELPEGIEPIIERCLPYGEGTVRSLTKRGLGPKLLFAFGPWYRAVTDPASDRSRRYAELIWPVARDAFRINAAISKFCYLAGVLHALGTSQGRPVIRLDQAQLTAALRHAAARARARVAGLTAADWRGMPVDYSRLRDAPAGSAAPGAPGAAAGRDRDGGYAQSVIAGLKTAMRAHAPLAPGLPGCGGQPGQDEDWASRLAGPGTHALIRQVLDELRGRDAPVSEADLVGFARRTGLPFRVCCELVEREFWAADLIPAG
jgi:Glycosyl transferase family 2